MILKNGSMHVDKKFQGFIWEENRKFSTFSEMDNVKLISLNVENSTVSFEITLSSILNFCQSDLFVHNHIHRDISVCPVSI